jgi:hypothetical protein
MRHRLFCCPLLHASTAKLTLLLLLLLLLIQTPTGQGGRH